MTAQIIHLSTRRKAHEASRIHPLLWPYVASIGLWEAYLMSLLAVRDPVQAKTIILQLEE